jgi:hypothetical protein
MADVTNFYLEGQEKYAPSAEDLLSTSTFDVKGVPVIENPDDDAFAATM